MCTHLIGLNRPSANEDRCLMSHQYIEWVALRSQEILRKATTISRTPLMLKLIGAKSSTHGNVLMTITTCAHDCQVFLCHWRS